MVMEDAVTQSIHGKFLVLEPVLDALARSRSLKPSSASSPRFSRMARR